MENIPIWAQALILVVLLLTGLGLVSCGGKSNPSPSASSGLKFRAYVSQDVTLGPTHSGPQAVSPFAPRALPRFTATMRTSDFCLENR